MNWLLVLYIAGRVMSAEPADSYATCISRAEEKAERLLALSQTRGDLTLQCIVLPPYPAAEPDHRQPLVQEAEGQPQKD